MRKILLILAAAFCLTACFDDDREEILFSNYYGFGDVSGSRITMRRDGITLNVTEDKSDGAWQREKRIFLRCDVLRETAPDTYDIRMIDSAPVIERDALVKSQSSEEVYGNDAVSFDQDWGFDAQTVTINMACRYTSLQKSDKQHTLNLVFDDLRSSTDTLFFELRHQGFGESYENTDFEATDFQVNGSYLTFDFSGVMPAGVGKSIIVSIEWDWLVTNGYDMLEREKKHHQVVGTLILDK